MQFTGNPKTAVRVAGAEDLLAAKDMRELIPDLATRVAVVAVRQATGVETGGSPTAPIVVASSEIEPIIDELSRMSQDAADVFQSAAGLALDELAAAGFPETIIADQRIAS